MAQKKALAHSNYPKHILQFRISEIRRNLIEIEEIMAEETSPSQEMDSKKDFDVAIIKLSGQLHSLGLI